ncbi:hypothetical protein CISG_06813 [Coccidioides immitis RMSCC 3703]|uniref:Uncharacterized protein n=2 Tax=Coccidioides immitis TaxID=5501 RepID=A0A0J8QZY7_COCIT|nr:hypothetical protein CIRG_06896 [Coccidioides immitis RMSCC 2394]KMU78051.1 hypothetical protein CISG_06813 [Coccidioides immitis RMSCC 3703]
MSVDVSNLGETLKTRNVSPECQLASPDIICHRVPKIEQQESLLLDSRTGNTRGNPGGGGNSRPSPWGHLEIIETNAAHPASWPCMFGFHSTPPPRCTLMSEQQSAKAGFQDCPPGYGRLEGRAEFSAGSFEAFALSQIYTFAASQILALRRLFQHGDLHPVTRYGLLNFSAIHLSEPEQNDQRRNAPCEAHFLLEKTLESLLHKQFLNPVPSSAIGMAGDEVEQRLRRARDRGTRCQRNAKSCSLSPDKAALHPTSVSRPPSPKPLPISSGSFVSSGLSASDTIARLLIASLPAPPTAPHSFVTMC